MTRIAPSTTTTTTTTNNTGSAGIVVKVANGPDLRRFELAAPEAALIFERVEAYWPELVNPRITYLDEDGDDITLSSQNDLEEALSDSHTLRLKVVASTGNHLEDVSDFCGFGGHKGKGMCGGKGKGVFGGKCKGKGKGMFGGKGKGMFGGKGKGMCGGKGRHIAEALDITMDEARDLMHKARDGDQEAQSKLRAVRASKVAQALDIPEDEALNLIEQAHNGDQEAKDKLHAARRAHRGEHRPHHHHEHPHGPFGKGRGRGLFGKGSKRKFAAYVHQLSKHLREANLGSDEDSSSSSE